MDKPDNIKRLETLRKMATAALAPESQPDEVTKDHITDALTAILSREAARDQRDKELVALITEVGKKIDSIPTLVRRATPPAMAPVPPATPEDSPGVTELRSLLERILWWLRFASVTIGAPVLALLLWLIVNFLHRVSE